MDKTNIKVTVNNSNVEELNTPDPIQEFVQNSREGYANSIETVQKELLKLNNLESFEDAEQKGFMFLVTEYKRDTKDIDNKGSEILLTQTCEVKLVKVCSTKNVKHTTKLVITENQENATA